ncbi:MAG: hypothetical protein ACXWYQ_05160 [Actinomycetota bacterium]
MNVTSAIPDLSPDEVRGMLAGLPRADGYDLHVKYLRYREKPHLSAWTDFSDRSITLQVPEPFLPFGEVVPYGAMRRPGAGKGKLRFIWLTEGLTFREPREVLRFLYCHEWMHWYLRERLGRKAAAETTCDRFALRNHLKEMVTEMDAKEALSRRRGQA